MHENDEQNNVAVKNEISKENHDLWFKPLI